MKSFRSLLLLVSVMTLFTCSAVIEVTASSQEDAIQQRIAVAERFARALNDRDNNSLKEIVDFEALAELAAGYAFAKDDPGRSSFIEGYLGAQDKILKQWFLLLDQTQGAAGYRRIVDRSGQSCPLIRLDLKDSGLNYLELIVEPRGQQWKIVDWYTYSSGQLTSETSGTIAVLALTKNKNILHRLLGTTKFDMNMIGKIMDANEYKQNKKYQEALDSLLSLPPEIRDTKAVFHMRIGNAQMIDPKAYRSQLALFAEQYSNDPTLALILLDHYYFHADYAQVIRLIDNLLQRVGPDNILEFMKASMLFEAKNYKKSAEHTLSAIDQAPLNENYYWLALSNYLQLKEFQKVADMLDLFALRFNFSYNPAALLEDKTYSDFVKSPVFEKWKLKWQ